MNKFDVQTNILTISPQLLLSQKIHTVFERKRIKGRDFFDIVFLLGITQNPDYRYLQEKL
jgi:Nucleotidyl transferase AbiEii toxin, Type IV TA system